MARKSDGTVYIDTKLDTKGFGRGMNSMQSQVGGLMGSFKKLGGIIALAFSVKQLVQFSKKAIELGSDLQEVQNVVDTVFTTMSEQVNEFAKGAAESAGLSETMAKRYTGTFGAMAKAFGFAESESFAMSTALTQLAGDVASFYNITQDEAYTKLKSVFTGETESLKDLGVVMTQSALDSFALAEGIGKTTKAMSEQEKVALRYRFVMNQLSSANGDFLRTSDSWANQTRLLKLNIESIMATFGQGLINFFTPVIKLINALLSKVATLANAFKAFSEMIMGNKSGGGGSGATASAVGDIASGYEDVADNATDAETATEKANKANKKYLSGLDEIKTFTSDTSNATDISGISGGAIQGQPVDFGTINQEGEETNTIFDRLIDRVKELAGIFKDGFSDTWNNLNIGAQLEDIRTKATLLKDSLIDIFTDENVLNSANNWLDTIAYSLGQITASVASIGLTIGQNLIGGLAKYLDQNKDRIKQFIISVFDISAEIWQITGQLSEAIAYIFQAFGTENGQQLTANIIGIFSNAAMGIVEIFGRLSRDITTFLYQPIIDNSEKIRTALDGIIEYLASITQTVKDFIDSMVNKALEVYDQHIKPLFDSLTSGISELVSQWLDVWNNNVKPMLDRLAEKFDTVVKEHIQPGMETAFDLIGKVADLLKVLWENVLQPFLGWIIDNVLPVIIPIIEQLVSNAMDAGAFISDVINNIMTILGGLIDFVTGVFSGDWEKAFSGIQTIFETVFDNIKSVFDSVVEFFQDKISEIKSAFESLKDAFSSKSSRISSFFSGFNISIPTIDTSKYKSVNIPALASGTVIPPNAPFMAILGDQKHGKNIEAPLDTIKQAVREVVGNGTSGTLHNHLYLDSREVYNAIIDMAKLEQTATGQNPLLLV